MVEYETWKVAKSASPYETGAFYWVKLEPYKTPGGVFQVGSRTETMPDETVTPTWEPMQRSSAGTWFRVGVIYQFPDAEVEEVGERITRENKEHADT
jgi:hypothetical protein